MFLKENSQMLNVHLIYVSSLETGDVEISRKIYTSFVGAVEDIDNVIIKYAEDRKANYKIVSKEDFDRKKLIKEQVSLIFRKKKSSINIFKKIVNEGRVWNDYKLEKVGKIGILSEISIPIDEKLLQLIVPSTNPSKDINDMKEIKEIKEIKVVKEIKEIGLNQPTPSNYEHGQHVSFIQELKEKLQRRRVSIQGSDSPSVSKDRTFENTFVDSLNKGKNKLKHVTPPPSPNFGLGRVVSYSKPETIETNDESSELSWDSTEEIIQYDESMFNDNILYEPPEMFMEYEELGANSLLKYDNEDIYTDAEWDIIEYYEGITNSNPISRKYIENAKRLSL